MQKHMCLDCDTFESNFYYTWNAKKIEKKIIPWKFKQMW